ncbi:hypothetical protein GALL_301890 [mine drainage metagenome]|uniref:Uncharacterized protein n=1 Tax=mine drainage metagenome TaxID=410659 RepID=A0A1J5R7A6_9ZZZZ
MEKNRMTEALAGVVTTGVVAASVGTAVAGGSLPAYCVWHDFGVGNDPRSPDTGVVTDSTGTLYGVTRDCGPRWRGTVHAVDAASGAETELHRSGGMSPGDGEAPRAGLLIDADAELIGTAQAAGTNDTGTVFALPRRASPTRRQG